MAENVPRQQKEEKKSMFSAFENLLKTKGLFDDGVPVDFLPKVVFIAAILLFYIGNTHYAERTVRNIEKMKVHVDDLRADYTTIKSEVMYSSKQSEVARRVAVFGIEESLQAPYKLNVKAEEIEIDPAE